MPRAAALLVVALATTLSTAYEFIVPNISKGTIDGGDFATNPNNFKYGNFSGEGRGQGGIL